MFGSVFTLLRVQLNIIHAQQELLAQFLAAIPPVALFLSFELLLAQLKETAGDWKHKTAWLKSIAKSKKKNQSWLKLPGIVRQPLKNWKEKSDN